MTAPRMPERFNELAAYNSRVAQGVVHTPEYVEHMNHLQAEFDWWSEISSHVDSTMRRRRRLLQRLAP